MEEVGEALTETETETEVPAKVQTITVHALSGTTGA